MDTCDFGDDDFLDNDEGYVAPNPWGIDLKGV